MFLSLINKRKKKGVFLKNFPRKVKELIEREKD